VLQPYYYRTTIIALAPARAALAERMLAQVI
jgi:hypothetical protein